VDGRRHERVRVTHDRPDVEVVLPVLDCNMEFPSSAIEVRDDRVMSR